MPSATAVMEREETAPASAPAHVTVQVPVPFDALLGIVRELDDDRLEALRLAVADAVAARQPAPPAAASDEAEAERQAAIARSRAAWEESLAAQPAISRAAHEFLKALGIDEMKPIGAARVREMMRQGGIRDEDNAFSREIIAMREE